MHLQNRIYSFIGLSNEDFGSFSKCLWEFLHRFKQMVKVLPSSEMDQIYDTIKEAISEFLDEIDHYFGI